MIYKITKSNTRRNRGCAACLWNFQAVQNTRTQLISYPSKINQFLIGPGSLILQQLIR